jgi:hypothetical protein
MHESGNGVYLCLRITTTVIILCLSLVMLYLVADVGDYHALWLIFTLASFTNVLLEMSIYYRVNDPPTDDNGMVHRAPVRAESFVRSIPNASKVDDIEPLMSSMDGSVSIDNNIKAFKDTKTLYIILHNENDESRPSAVTERNYSQNNPEMINDIENAINNLVSQNKTADESNPPTKRHSSICESLRSMREKRLRESMESPRFGRDSRHSSITKKNSVMLPSSLRDELELAYTSKIFSPSYMLSISFK